MKNAMRTDTMMETLTELAAADKDAKTLIPSLQGRMQTIRSSTQLLGQC